MQGDPDSTPLLLKPVRGGRGVLFHRSKGGLWLVVSLVLVDRQGVLTAYGSLSSLT